MTNSQLNTEAAEAIMALPQISVFGPDRSAAINAVQDIIDLEKANTAFGFLQANEDAIRGLALEAATARRKVEMLAERMEAEAKQIRHSLTTTTGSLISSASTSTAAELAAAAATYTLSLQTLNDLLGDRFESVIEALIASPWRAPLA